MTDFVRTDYGKVSVHVFEQKTITHVLVGKNSLTFCITRSRCLKFAQSFLENVKITDE